MDVIRMGMSKHLPSILTGLSLGLLVACTPGEPANADAKPDAKPNGKQVYEAQKCSRCHRAGGKLDLAGVGKRRDAAWLKRYLQEQEKVNGRTHKPKFEGSAAELDALVAWLVSRK